MEDSDVRAEPNMKEEAAQGEPTQGGKSDNEVDDDDDNDERKEDSQAEEDKDSQAGEEEEEHLEDLKNSPEVRRRRPRKD